MWSYHVICDFSSLLNLDVVRFARNLLTMVKHINFRDHVDDHPRAGWSDHMDGLPCDRGGGQAAHSRQGWCYWHLRGGPFQELDQPEITICCAGVPQRHQRASCSRDWGRVGHREAYVPEVTMIIIMLILFLVVTTIVVMSLMISMKVCSAGGYCCNMGHQHCEWTIIDVITIIVVIITNIILITIIGTIITRLETMRLWTW